MSCLKAWIGQQCGRISAVNNNKNNNTKIYNGVPGSRGSASRVLPHETWPMVLLTGCFCLLTSCGTRLTLNGLEVISVVRGLSKGKLLFCRYVVVQQTFACFVGFDNVRGDNAVQMVSRTRGLYLCFRVCFNGNDFKIGILVLS